MADYITTYTGVHFDPVHPIQEDIRIEDIAHALSMLCRGNGHVKIFYSVGEHCLNCAAEAIARGYSKRVALACLLHDASECYMSDVPSPFKRVLKDYIEWENKLLAMVYQKFLGSKLTKDEEKLVSEIDHDVLLYDLYELLGEGSKEKLPKLYKPYRYGELSFREVEMKYLETYTALTI